MSGQESPRITKHLFPMIDLMVSNAVKEVEEDGQTISCRKGCTHCCHLLVEVSWEEATELACWIRDQPEDRRKHFIGRVAENAEIAREIFDKRKSTKKFLEPYRGDKEINEKAYDDYFYGRVTPCIFLEDGSCQAYEARPTACRLHMVTSDPDLCRHDIDDDDNYEIPDRFEELKEDTAPMITSIERDGRWGQMAILVEAVLKEMGID